MGLLRAMTLLMLPPLGLPPVQLRSARKGSVRSTGGPALENAGYCCHVLPQMQRVDGAYDGAADRRVAEYQLEAGGERVLTFQADVPAGQRLFHQDALAVLRSVIQNRTLGLLAQVPGDHGAVAVAQGLNATGHCLAGEAEGADQALLFQLL